jgi:hypothetical protein
MVESADLVSTARKGATAVNGASAANQPSTSMTTSTGALPPLPTTTSPLSFKRATVKPATD